MMMFDRPSEKPYFTTGTKLDTFYFNPHNSVQNRVSIYVLLDYDISFDTKHDNSQIPQ